MQKLLLLHGAIGASDQLSITKDALKDNYEVHTLNFNGHGGSAFLDIGFSIAAFAEETLNYINENKLGSVSIFGYSMGGYVAMYLAKHHPEKVNKIVTLATKFHWDEETAAREVKMLNADKIAEKLPAFASALEQRHAPNDWREILRKTVDMLMDMGADNPLKLEDYASIEHESMVLLGDRDKMITLEETTDVYKALPSAQMGMLPQTHHPIEQVNIPYLVYYIKQFIQ